MQKNVRKEMSKNTVPCKCCGGHPKVLHSASETEGAYFAVYCASVGCSVSTEKWKTESEAMRSWNHHNRQGAKI